MSNEQEISDELRKRAIDDLNADSVKSGWLKSWHYPEDKNAPAVTAMAKQLKAAGETQSAFEAEVQGSNELREQLAERDAEIAALRERLAKHEPDQEPDKPEDPFLVKARELAAKYQREVMGSYGVARSTRTREQDNFAATQSFLEALKAGAAMTPQPGWIEHSGKAVRCRAARWLRLSIGAALKKQARRMRGIFLG